MGVVAFDHQWGHSSIQLAPSLILSCAKQRGHPIQPLGPWLGACTWSLDVPFSLHSAVQDPRRQGPSFALFFLVTG